MSKSNEEINAIIHRKLFGGCWHERDAEKSAIVTWICKLCGAEFHLQRGASPNPNYSTDIVQAFKVVEKMEADGCLFEISNNVEEYTNLKAYLVDIWKPRKSKGVTVDKSLPMAICKAALRAIGEKV